MSVLAYMYVHVRTCTCTSTAKLFQSGIKIVTENIGTKLLDMKTKIY